MAQFLYDESRRGDDVTAEHYVTDIGCWRNARGPKPPQVEVAVIRASKEIAHLTTRRKASGSPGKIWDPEEVVCAFIQPLKLFGAHASPGRLDASVPAFIAPPPPTTTPYQ